MTVASYFVVLALCDEPGVGEGSLIARVIYLVVSTDEHINVGGLQPIIASCSKTFLPFPVQACSFGGAWKFAGKPLSIRMFWPSSVCMK